MLAVCRRSQVEEELPERAAGQVLRRCEDVASVGEAPTAGWVALGRAALVELGIVETSALGTAAVASEHQMSVQVRSFDVSQVARSLDLEPYRELRVLGRFLGVEGVAGLVEQEPAVASYRALVAGVVRQVLRVVVLGFAGPLVDAFVSRLASAFAFRDCDESPRVPDRTRGNGHLYIDDNDSKRTAN